MSFKSDTIDRYMYYEHSRGFRGQDENCFVTRARGARSAQIFIEKYLNGPKQSYKVQIAAENWYFDPSTAWILFIIFELFVWLWLLAFFCFK